MIEYPETISIIASIDGLSYILCLYDFHVLCSVDLRKPSRCDLLDSNGYLIGHWLPLSLTVDSDYCEDWLKRYPVPNGSAVAFDFSGNPVRAYKLKNGVLVND